MKKYHQFILILTIVLITTGVEAQTEHLVEGRTMGTTYHIKVVTGAAGSVTGLKEKIDRRLAQINQVFSTYIKDSEISRFNSLKQADEKFRVSDDFIRVMRVAAEIYQLSGGAWDGTVNPLVDLWGFGPTQRLPKKPPAAEITALKQKIGFDRIRVEAPNFLVKKMAAVTLDLNSIAKGFAVDQISELLAAKGFENYLVEIGGEVYAAGVRADGKNWRVGINRPQKDAAFDEVYKAVSIANRAFATSGDYRNFFEIDGVRYSHVIDPRSGYPVSNGVVSVSIIAGNCTLADGLATAIMVLGAEKGIQLVNRLENTECLIVVQKPDGRLADFTSKGFATTNP
ncbi:MAG: FAD:protein FMN transferase [Deltaproteobacteria bacterium]|jgi:thiamine biosynthesis lipoprotein|nr:FAD:protein FMN transferase [Deltaproteobacteria bacterium]